MSTITQVEVRCPNCANYPACKAVEGRYGDTLRGNGGNWRALREGGRRVPSPVRRCAEVWTRQVLGGFRDGRMLEIGCGPSPVFSGKDCEERRINYIGLDETLPFQGCDRLPFKDLQQRLVMKTARFLGIRKLPGRTSRQRFIRDTFPSRHVQDYKFDVIYGNSTIEHWHERNFDIEASTALYKRDITACRRLMNDGGRLLMSCPVYVHGNHIFMLGRLDRLQSLFAEGWVRVTFEYWRRDFGDLMPYCPTARRGHFQAAFGIALENMFLVNVTAVA